MFLGPYNLYDIISVNEKPTLEITAIVFDLEEKLYHHLHHNRLSIRNQTLEDCIEKNNAQVELINLSIAEVRILLKDNPGSTKRKTQLKYLSNTLDHFVNWYKDKELPMPGIVLAMEWSKGSFSANQDFSIITINDDTYNLSPNQSKVVELLFNNLTNALDGLSYRDMVRETDLTRSGKLSNYFKGSPRVGDLFNYSRRTGKYSLKY
jgi:hypothetical protein